MDLSGVLGMLRRRWLAVAVAILAGGVGAFLATESSEPQYRASSQLFLNIPPTREVGEALQGVQLSSHLIQSYARVATSRRVATLAAERLGTDDWQGVQASLSATTEQDTLLLALS